MASEADIGEPVGPLADLETLREGLAALERLRRHEHVMRLENECLLRGLVHLNEARNTREVFDHVVGVLQDLVPFWNVFLLVSGPRGFRVTLSTARSLIGLRWPPDSILARVLAGETVGLFDASRVGEWRGLPAGLGSAAGSVVMTPVRSQTVRGAMVFIHPDKAVFTHHHQRLIRRFSPLIDQAMASIEAREMLENERNLAEAAIRARQKETGERRRAEAETRHLSTLMESAIEYAPIYVWEVDDQDRYTFVKGAEKILGHASESMLGHPVREFLGKGAVEQNERAVAAAVDARQPFANLVVRRRRAAGGNVWVSVSGRPIFDDRGVFRGFRGVSVDVTESVETKLRLEEMALHDALTGLANRRMFLEHFEAARARMIRYARPLSMLALDVDLFKQVNDTLGHPAGDEVLTAVARRLVRHVRKSDLVARFGGDEFMILLPEAGSAGAAEVAEKIRTDLGGRGIAVGNPPARVAVTVSIGIATMTRKAPLSFDDLMEAADQALYAAKLRGRNCICVAGTG